MDKTWSTQERVWAENKGDRSPTKWQTEPFRGPHWMQCQIGSCSFCFWGETNKPNCSHQPSPATSALLPWLVLKPHVQTQLATSGGQIKRWLNLFENPLGSTSWQLNSFDCLTTSPNVIVSAVFIKSWSPRCPAPLIVEQFAAPQKMSQNMVECHLQVKLTG